MTALLVIRWQSKRRTSEVMRHKRIRTRAISEMVGV